jgi:hypothetical protein
MVSLIFVSGEEAYRSGVLHFQSCFQILDKAETACHDKRSSLLLRQKKFIRYLHWIPFWAQRYKNIYKRNL